MMNGHTVETADHLTKTGVANQAATQTKSLHDLNASLLKVTKSTITRPVPVSLVSFHICFDRRKLRSSFQSDHESLFLQL
jgi:hypothetical protein